MVPLVHLIIELAMSDMYRLRRGIIFKNTGTETLWFLEMFRSNRFEDVSLNQWMALTPKEIVESNIHVGPQVMDSLRKEKWPVVKYPGFSYSPKSDE